MITPQGGWDTPPTPEPGSKPVETKDTSSTGRKWSARVLLALSGLWIVVSVMMVLSGQRSLLDALDISNPSILGIVGFISVIAYFVVRPNKQ
jgi:drug/metabolite transporter superfamily protein YnfA